MSINLYDRQLELERATFDVATLKAQLKSGPSNAVMLALKRQVEPLADAIAEWSKPSVGRGGSTKKWVRELNLDSYEVAFIILKSLVTLSINTEKSLVSVSRVLVKNLLSQSQYKAFVAAGRDNPRLKRYREAVEGNLELTNSGERKAKVLINAARREHVDLGIEALEPNQETLLGMALVDLAINTTGMFKKPRRKRNTRGKGYKVMCLEASDDFIKWVEQVEPELIRLHCAFEPMVVKPLPWRPDSIGGYLDHPRPYKLISGWTKANPQPEPLVYQALNTIQSTPWRVNKFILQVQQEIWSRDLGIAGIPHRFSQAAAKERVPDAVWESWDREQKREWKKQRTLEYQQEAQQRSDQVTTTMRLTMADKFKDYENIWFPHQLDFRGRVYPLPSILSPQGEDANKALLEFGEPGVLDENSVKWLKIHIANCWGEDKCSFEDRIKWVDANTWMLCCAVEPLDYLEWTKADKPFCFLAACHELLAYDLGVVHGELESVPSAIPIAQDGTCSGLQHYSALLLDSFGGHATNLTPTDQPQDIYQLVADEAERILESTLSTATEASDDTHMASVWKGKVTRKVTKRNVMTTPYGVTRFGATEQLEGVIKDGDADIECDDNAKAARYMARVINESLRHVIVSAADGMAWLTKCADIITKETGKDPEWVTPIGMHVIHRYRKQNYKKVDTLFGGTRLQLSVNTSEKKAVNIGKNCLAIAPNVIHSLDASHLMMTVLAAQEQGVQQFAVIHDSFGTTADRVDILRSALRAEFVSQYKGNWFAHLKAQWEGEFNVTLPMPPSQGTLDIQQVLDSEYIFN